MTTNFPTSLDSLVNPLGTDPVSLPSHAAQHANINDAVEALETKVGIDGSLDTNSLEYRVTYLETASNTTYTDEKAQDAVGLNVGTGLTYSDSTGSISVTTNTYDAYGAASTAQTSAQNYADNAVSTHSLDTTNVHGITDTSALATKTYADNSSAAAQTAAELAAASYTDTEIGTEISNRNSAITTAINALTTSDIEEGSNLYFTDERAQDAVNTAIIAGTNITKTYDDVANTITLDVDVAVGEIDSITFDTTAGITPTTVGQASWDAANETLQILLNGDVTLQVGQEHIIRVKNASGSVAIPDRTAVMFAGATGDTVTVNPAISTSSYEPHYLVGITTEEIPADGFGFVTQFGFVNHVNTNGWNLGDLLYVDPATPGGLTSTQPSAPNWKFPIAAVTRKHAQSGRIFVRAIPGAYLHDLSDVAIDSPADKELVSYHASNGTWINQTSDELGLATKTYADAAVSTHSSDTTDVHGIADTSALATKTYADTAASAPLTLTQSENNAKYPLTIASANETGGGSGYSDLIKFTNTKAGATNINKHLRFNSTGSLEIINSAYTQNLLSISDSGNILTGGTITAGAYNAGQTIKTTIWSNGDMGFNSNYTTASSSYTTIASKTYTPASISSYIFVEVYARYDVNGGAGDTWYSQLTWNGAEFGYQHENWTNGAGGGSRSSKLFPLTGRITNSSLTGYTLAINAKRDNSDDTLTVNADSAFYVKITEIAR